MNEHDLQLLLTRRWVERGLTVERRRHLLIAWEVMLPSWRINDSRKHWDEPSLDFLVADERMDLTVVELKAESPGVKPAWRAIVQVTHRAALLLREFSWKNLHGAYESCWSGDHGRVEPGNSLPLLERHRRFFRLDAHVPMGSPVVRRCVAVPHVRPPWRKVLAEFNGLAGVALRDEVNRQLSSKACRRERDRFNDASTQKQLARLTPVVLLDLLEQGHLESPALSLT